MISIISQDRILPYFSEDSSKSLINNWFMQLIAIEPVSFNELLDRSIRLIIQ